MRRLILALVIFLVLVLFVSISLNPLIIFLVKQNLGHIFLGSEVRIGNCSTKPLQQIILSDLEVSKKPIYDFKIKEIKIEYSLFSIIKRKILAVSLQDAAVTLELGQRGILDLKDKYISLKTDKKGAKKSAFFVERLELAKIDLNLNSADLNLKTRMSALINSFLQRVNSLDLEINTLQSKGLEIENAELEASQDLASGSLNIERIKYGKLKIENIKSNVRFDKEFLFLDSLSAQVLGGKTQGNVNLVTEKNPEYLIELEFKDLDIDTFINDFNLDEKVKASGRLNGRMLLKGSGLNISVLDGDFATTEEGGILTIKDTRYLENLARKSGQSLNILVESFKNYHYNIGLLRLYLDKGNLILDIALEGKSGKRNLTIVLHDFKIRR